MPNTRPSPASGPGWRAWLIWGVAIGGYILAITNRSSLSAVGVDAAERFGAHAATLSLFAVVQLAVYGGMQIPIGVLLDRHGARPIMVIGMLLMALGQFVMAVSPSIGVALVARVLLGAGDAAVFPAVLRLVATWFPAQRGPLMVQLTGLSGQSGQLVALLPLAALLHSTSWTVTFGSIAGLGLLFAVLIWLVVRNRPAERAADVSVNTETGAVQVVTSAIDTGADFRVDAHTRIIVDEAGMIDQVIAHALVQIANENGAALAFIGDRAQLPAVGRGGVLDMAVDAHPTPLDLTNLHRFVTPEGGLDTEYATLTLQMRSREAPAELFDQLYERGNLVIHETMDDARAVITDDAIARARAGSSVAIATATNEEAAALNALIQQAHAQAGHTTAATVEISGSDLLTIRNGDRLMTRKNDRDLGVANRDVWNVQRVHRSGEVTVTDGKRLVKLPPEYVKEHTHLAYASTEFGVQGATVQAGHGIVTDSSSASAVYVSATRGRESNTLHVVAETRLQARELFVDAMTREAGDRGVEMKRAGAVRDLQGTTGTRTHTETQRAQAAWWGVDVDRPTTRPATSARSAQRDLERNIDRARQTTSTRAADATARTARDAEATQVARDAAKARRRARDRGLER